MDAVLFVRCALVRVSRRAPSSTPGMRHEVCETETCSAPPREIHAHRTGRFLVSAWTQISHHFLPAENSKSRIAEVECGRADSDHGAGRQ